MKRKPKVTPIKRVESSQVTDLKAPPKQLPRVKLNSREFDIEVWAKKAKRKR